MGGEGVKCEKKIVGSDQLRRRDIRPVRGMARGGDRQEQRAHRGKFSVQPFGIVCSRLYGRRMQPCLHSAERSRLLAILHIGTGSEDIECTRMEKQRLKNSDIAGPTSLTRSRLSQRNSRGRLIKALCW